MPQSEGLTDYQDQLNIETPEQVEIRFAIAGAGSRFLAILVDSILQAVVQILLALLLILIGATFPTFGQSIPDKWITAGIILVYFALYWGYFSLFETFWNGQTPGKRIFHIRVIKDTGRRITLFESLARNLIRVIDMLPGIYLVGVVSMMCNRQQKRLGDLVAGTIVVHERREDQPLLGHNSRSFTSGLYAQPAPDPRMQTPADFAGPGNPIPADAIGRLTPRDLQTIETFLARALDFDAEVRERMAARVAAQVSDRMNYPLPEGTNPERFLEAVAFAMRAQSRF